ncbi:sigma-70 family RNA polymerase sigma factor [Pseudonocardia xinjiangensis]|uniref:sigma-70 family RNA polymerase sigma factor n=1 Tax=Pseudonocardia xinjiangensis TaxID=75289 RepID=UPI003D90DE1D
MPDQKDNPPRDPRLRHEDPSGAAALMRLVHDRHSGALRSFAMRLTGGNASKAEDVVQETMLRAWRHLDALDEARGSQRTWLFTVARRIAIDEWRSRPERIEYPTDVVPELIAEDTIDRAVQRWTVTAALNRLSREHRSALHACYFHGRSVREAAREFGVPEGTVKSRLYYGLRAMRVVLEGGELVTSTNSPTSALPSAVASAAIRAGATRPRRHGQLSSRSPGPRRTPPAPGSC